MLTLKPLFYLQQYRGYTGMYKVLICIPSRRIPAKAKRRLSLRVEYGVVLSERSPTPTQHENPKTPEVAKKV